MASLNSKKRKADAVNEDIYARLKRKQLATLGEKCLPAGSQYNLHKHNKLFSDTFTARHYTLPVDDFVEKFINEGYKMCEFNEKTKQWESVGEERTDYLVKKRQENFQQRSRGKLTKGTKKRDKKEEHLQLQTALLAKEKEVARLVAELEKSSEAARMMHLETFRLLKEVVELRRAKAVAEARATDLEEELGALIYKSSHPANRNIHSRGEDDEKPPRSIAGTVEVREARAGAGKITTPTASTSELEKSKAKTTIGTAKSTISVIGFKNPNKLPVFMTISERIDAFHKVQDLVNNREPFETVQMVLDAAKITRPCYHSWKKSVPEWEKAVAACPAYGRARNFDKDWANVLARQNNSNSGDNIPVTRSDEGNSASQSTTRNHACSQQDRAKRKAEEIEATTSAEIDTTTTSSISELEKVNKKMKVLQKQSQRAHEKNSEQQARMHEEQRENEESMAKGAKQEANQEKAMSEKGRSDDADGDENDDNNSWTEEDWEILCRMLCDKIEEVQSKNRSLKNRKDHYKNRCLELTNQHGNEIEGASSCKKGGVQQGSADTIESGEGSVTTKSKRDESDEEGSVEKIQRTD